MIVQLYIAHFHLTILPWVKLRVSIDASIWALGHVSPCHVIFHLCLVIGKTQFISVIFPSQGAVTYQLPSAGVSWSSMFRQLEANKERLGIIDYSVSQTTLEQVNLS